MSDEALGALAELHGVATSFWDVGGTQHHASPESLRAVLSALGVESQSPADAVRAKTARRHRTVVEPVVALRGAGGQVVEIAIPRSVHPRDVWLTVTLEDGRQGRTRLMPAIHRPAGTALVDGVAVDRYEVRVSQTAEGLGPGYHRLQVEGPGIDAWSLLLVAPRCPVPERGWGAFLPVHALRTERDWGVGNYPAFAELAQAIGGLGGQLLASLPLYPWLDDGEEAFSPYRPATRLGWNELYVDPLILPELESAPETRALVESEGFRAELAHARRSVSVDYRASAGLVRRALEPLARALYARPSARRGALAAFAAARPDLVAYARFRAGADFLTADRLYGDGITGEGGVAWPPAGSDGALEHLGSEEARYQLYAQFVAAEQVAACGDRLLLDLPVGTHPGGFDPRFEPGVFVGGVEVGAPPDLFFDQGQRWGFSPFHPRALRAQGYRHLGAILRHVMSRAAALRIDHVMGLHRLWWVPDGAPATAGAYVRYPAAELRAVACLEAWRADTAVVGEDLGTVPDEVRQGMAEDRMLRSWVLEFEVRPDQPFPDPPELSMASVGTHDLDRFAVFFDRPEQSSWHRVMGGDTRRALRASLDHMAESPARLVMVDLEDLWLERHPHNRPGTPASAGNWQHRSTRTLTEMAADPAVGTALRRVDELRRQEESE